MLGFQVGDVFAAYLKRHGFVGIGKLTDRAKPIRQVTIKGKPLLKHDLRCKKMDDNIESNDLCEYVAPVKWLVAVERAQAKWKGKSKLYTTPLVRASLDGQLKTIEFLEREFKVKIHSFLD